MLMYFALPFSFSHSDIWSCFPLPRISSMECVELDIWSAAELDDGMRCNGSVSQCDKISCDAVTLAVLHAIRFITTGIYYIY